jgi:SH3-like domain-containing protein
VIAHAASLLSGGVPDDNITLRRELEAKVLDAVAKRNRTGIGRMGGLAMRGVVLAAALLATSVSHSAASAQDMTAGSVTGLPIPRYVSLKSDRVNLREGPSKEHRTRWVFQRAGLPVEITGEFETWRRVRDADGSEGWVLHSLLSGRRTALVAPWSKDESFPLYQSADESASVIARLQPGVIANVASCANAWCHISIAKTDGYIKQERLWGVYPNEKVD